ncbi:hypothetical protein OA492_01215 [Pelagibacteraceae bacterium]|nr:hypothetical protein [Pelagibacteraceae bacterium]
MGTISLKDISKLFRSMMTSFVTVTAPLIVAFIIAKKRLIEGIMLTGMK